MWGDTTKQVEQAAIRALEALKATPKKKKKGSDIFNEACKLIDNYEKTVSENVFKSYLSSLSRDPESRILKDAGSHGYYLKPAEEEKPVEEEEEKKMLDTNPVEKQDLMPQVKKENERLLYPILEAWLQSKGYRTKNTSMMKGMGKWGNPDITGIVVDESLGSYYIELVTIEAKTTNKHYQYDFFETVSHKRFSNRVYFSFASTANFLRENSDELRYYSELYGVGVVVIALEEPHFNEYTEGKLTEIDTDRVDVYEVYSAIFEPRLRRWQKTFLEQLGISNTKELWGWGNA